MYKVLITATNYDELCKEGLELLKDNDCEVVLTPFNRAHTEDELLRVVGDIDGVIANVDPWTAKVMSEAKHLKAIAMFGTGVDHIDLEEAKKRGIVVTNCPGLNAPAVAEHTIALMMSALRHIPRLAAITKGGEWPQVSFHELEFKTVGILGFGTIGQRVAKILRGFNVKVIAYNRTPRPEIAEELGVALCDFETVMKESDVILIHMASNKDTFHLINERSLKLVKHSALIVNTSRGALVDEKAVAAALEKKQFELYATDVFEKEPVDQDNPLLGLENVLVTPHSAGQTYENYRKTGLATATAIVDVFKGREPLNRRA